MDRLSAERIAAELRRLLVAPQAMRAVDALFDYGLLSDLLGNVPRLERLRRLVAIEEAQGLALDAMLRLAALAVFVAEDPERLAARLRLSNAEQAVLALAAQDRAMSGLPDEDAARRALYRLGPDHFAKHVLIAWADSGASPEDQNWRKALGLAGRWQAPSFPLRGSDIMPLGKLEGPEIGAILRRLEAEWIADGFAASREELLARAAELSRRSSTQDR
jgi:poly(A) polymerase